MSNNLKSLKLWEKAQQYIPGGVNSPVRAFNNVEKDPFFIDKGKGPHLFDIDHNKYIDYVCSWGPLILGHSHPDVIAAVQNALADGLGFGAPTAIEVELAALVTTLMPSMEMIRMVNSGTEATLSAIRLARGFTKRNKIIKFADCYHGHSDGLLVKAGSGALTLGLPNSAGIPSSIAEQTLISTFNNLEVTKQLFAKYGDDIAAIIVEPVAANMNLLLPESGFLQGLRDLCDKHGSLLIFDEVITGFRVSLGGAQELYNIKPDLTCLGKIVGGGLPVGAFGGRKDIMEYLAPLGPVYQAGTLSGNPISLSAGIATLRYCQQHPELYNHLNNASKFIATEMAASAKKHNVKLFTTSLCGLFGFQFIDDDNHILFKKFFNNMLDQGVYFAPSPFEVGFVSSTHTQEIIEETISKTAIAFANL